MQWSRGERAFAVSAYFSNSRLIIATQRAFRKQFNVAPKGRVPGRTSIIQWVDIFKNTGSVWQPNPGPSKTTRTPENVERVRQAVLQIGRYRDDRAVTVTSERYTRMIEEFFHKMCGFSKLVPLLTRQASMDLLREHFPRRLISQRGDLQWPARSPDLAPCDYFLWGYLKSVVYANRPRTRAELKNNIRAAIVDIGPDMLEKVEQNFRSRLTKCIEQRGGHLKDIIFKK